MDTTSFDEAYEKLDGFIAGLQRLEALTEADNLKYLTRVEREPIFETILGNLGDLEDIAKALIKGARAVRRARVRDDDQLSRMIIAMTEGGLRVDDYEGPSAVAAQYADAKSPEEVAAALDSFGTLALLQGAAAQLANSPEPEPEPGAMP